jgi:hypothetical protein
MGRLPVGKWAMTAAERQRRRRDRLPFWDRKTEVDRAQLEWWLEHGDVKQVAKWLSDCIDPARWTELNMGYWNSP